MSSTHRPRCHQSLDAPAITSPAYCFKWLSTSTTVLGGCSSVDTSYSCNQSLFAFDHCVLWSTKVSSVHGPTFLASLGSRSVSNMCGCTYNAVLFCSFLCVDVCLHAFYNCCSLSSSFSIPGRTVPYSRKLRVCCALDLQLHYPGTRHYQLWLFITSSWFTASYTASAPTDHAWPCSWPLVFTFTCRHDLFLLVFLDDVIDLCIYYGPQQL